MPLVHYHLLGETRLGKVRRSAVSTRGTRAEKVSTQSGFQVCRVETNAGFLMLWLAKWLMSPTIHEGDGGDVVTLLHCTVLLCRVTWNGADFILVIFLNCWTGVKLFLDCKGQQMPYLNAKLTIKSFEKNLRTRFSLKCNHIQLDQDQLVLIEICEGTTCQDCIISFRLLSKPPTSLGFKPLPFAWMNLNFM